MNGPVVRAPSFVRVTVVAPHRDQPAATTLPAPAEPDAPVPSPGAPPPTELEQEALAWDAAREHARIVARAVEREVGTHPDVRKVWADGDAVRVLLELAPPFARWPGWCEYFGITVADEPAGDSTPAGEGRRAGVRVSVLVRQAATAARPFRLGDTLYDLAVPYRDAHGVIWYFQGQRADDGMPLMSVDGRAERCSLANVAEYAGPLTPLPPSASEESG
ncbi:MULTISPECIES: BN159_2729 family protein [unclassified Streptomyces]|uniref:BN159_2729 family protein n=1 Tax=unclassified Streptomyces TaxID=2593676 RepID=UPI000A93C611|nr:MULTISPECIES: BN159_2729 family protein [unclassified Streptomyces]AZM59754.1 hypothetical protein DLM49_09450 [Streptomyces sp. WAC 01438]RSM93811.1 hypothetical protein DMA10_19960 [Streptomyces sp. WAC 01420]